MSTTTLAPAPTGTYAIDATHSRVGFVARHAMVTKVRGSFNEFEGTGYFDAEDPSQSHLALTIQAGGRPWPVQVCCVAGSRYLATPTGRRARRVALAGAARRAPAPKPRSAAVRP